MKDLKRELRKDIRKREWIGEIRDGRYGELRECIGETERRGQKKEERNDRGETRRGRNGRRNRRKTE